MNGWIEMRTALLHAILTALTDLLPCWPKYLGSPRYVHIDIFVIFCLQGRHPYSFIQAKKKIIVGLREIFLPLAGVSANQAK